MKVREGLVSNSSTSSFVINTFLYSGIITTPIIVYFGVRKYKEEIKNYWKSLKHKFAVNS